MSKVALLRYSQEVSRFASALDKRPGALLALDVGLRKVGVAVSDFHRIAAFPLCTLPREEHCDQSTLKMTRQLLDLISKYRVCAVVSGYPLELCRSQEGASCSMVRTFLASLYVTSDQIQSICPGLTPPLPCLLWDERFSSMSAHLFQYIDEPRRHGRAKPLPQWKKRGVDAYAALVILRGVLERDWARYRTPQESTLEK